MDDTTQPARDPIPTPATRRIAWLAFWLLVLVAPLALILALDSLVARFNEPAVAALRAGEHRASSASLPRDLAVTGWQPVRLPHSNRVSPGQVASHWYRIPFDAGATREGLWAVYLPRPYANVAVFINGEEIGNGGPMSRPLPFHRGPLLFTFPANLMRPGTNELLVRAVSSFSHAGVGRVHVAPLAALQPAYRFGRMMFVTLKQGLVVTMLLVGMVMAAMYLLRRREAPFGWFALGLSMWAAHIAIMLTAQAPIEPRSLWETFQGIAIGLYALCAAVFTLRFLGLHRPRIERFFAIFAVVGSLILLAGPWLLQRAFLEFFGLVWIPVVHAVGLYQLWLLLRAYHRRPDVEVALLAAVSWLVTAVGLRDTLVDANIIQSRYLYMTYTAAPVVFVFGAILLRRFVQALDATEHANEVLEGRVVEKSRELERNLVRLKDLERERALLEERERIMQDVHDGIGGHLVQALSIASARRELAPMEEPLRHCIDELRLMIDSIEPVNGDLASVLGTLRLRMSRRLAQAGVELRWHMGDLPPLPELGPRQVLGITRIVQEAITNVLKHSGSRSIDFTARAAGADEPFAVLIEVADQGCGFVAGERGEGTGRGLAGMRRRAQALRARIEVSSSPQGTCMRLLLPAASRGVSDRQAREQGLTAAGSPAHSAVLE